MPQVPAVPGLAGLKAATLDIFGPDGPLARNVPGFEPRAGQVEMAGAVADVIASGGVLLAEAGTGTGKTLAYLVPAILSRQRVLISTGTKNLQEQIYFKDIPALRHALGLSFTAACMKGRANYLCLHRYGQLEEGHGPAAHDVFLPMIRAWATRTETGDRAELEDLPEELPFWNEVSATAETCLGTECPRYDECYVTRMRQRAAEADLVIVNHHLLCADAALRHRGHGEVIPASSHVIVDEAHQLEDVVTQYFGISVSTYRIEDLALDIERLMAAGAAGERDIPDVEQAIAVLRDRARAFFGDLVRAHRSPDRMSSSRGEERVRATGASLAQPRDSGAGLTAALDLIEASLAPIAAPAAGADEGAEGPEDARAFARRAGEIRADLRALLRAGDTDPADFVHFVEFRGRGIFFRAAPIDVSAIVRETMLDRVRTAVFTSATLTVDGTFGYVRSRLGIRSADEIRLASEFDFATQAILYLPPRMPDPRSPDFTLAAGREVVEILRRTRGRAFVLFTSYATLRAVQAIAEMTLDYPIFVQGTAPRTQLLRQFRQTPHSVLFATSSFWQGVDVVGEALSCVIVDKLPFASPADPITSARIESIRAGGGEPFGEYQVPLAILSLQQGLGRLIRHRTDRGVLAVLDPRLKTRGYGRRFIASLPPAPLVHDLREVAGFMATL